MLRHRIIPALLLENSALVKTTKFKNPRYVGDPINAIRIFNDKQVDELLVLDIGATKKQCEPNFELIERFAGECFMPLAYVGGILSVDQAARLFSLGVEKVCVQNAALQRPFFITELAETFGSQSIIVSIDVKRNWLGKLKVYESATGKLLHDDYLDVIMKLVKAGAGELLINSVDKDGTLSGPDLTLIKEINDLVNIPIIVLGGVSSLADIKASIVAGASAVAAGSLFVFHGPHRAVLITYPEYAELEQLLEDVDDK